MTLYCPDTADLPFNPGRKPMPLWVHRQRPVHLTDLYRGRSCFLILNGPSFATLDHAPLRQPGVLTMTANNGFRTFRSNLWICHDEAGRFIRSVWSCPQVMKFVPLGRCRERIFDSNLWQWTHRTTADCPGVLFYPRKDGFDAKTFLDDPGVQTGSTEKPHSRCVMLAAIRILYELGVRRIFLLGCDFRMDHQTRYHFAQDRKAGPIANNTRTYTDMVRRFTSLKPRFESAGLHLYNCNPDSGLKVFEHVQYHDAVRAVQDEFGNIDWQNERTEGLYDQPKPALGVIRHVAGQKPQPVDLSALPEQKPMTLSSPVTMPASYEPGLTILTPTGDRHEAFALCERWMGRQNMPAALQWIVVDDGYRPTTCTMGQQYVRRERKPQDPAHTLALNIRTALPLVRYDKIVFIEDDEWYGPGYIEAMIRWLERVPLAGEAVNIYYHVASGQWKRSRLRGHTSLCRTGIRQEAYGVLAHAVRSDHWMVDARLWRGWRGGSALHDLDQPMSLGIKGMPGRRGQTAAHRPERNGNALDLDGSVLRRMIGQDAEYYARYRVVRQGQYNQQDSERQNDVTVPEQPVVQ